MKILKFVPNLFLFALVALVVFCTSCGRNKLRDLKAEETLGRILVQEVLKDGGQTKVLLVTTSSQNGLINAEVESFKKCAGAKKLSIADVVSFKMPPPTNRKDFGSSYTVEDLLGVLQKSDGVSTVVSFVGIPKLDQRELASVKGSNKKFIIVFNDRGEYERVQTSVEQLGALVFVYQPEKITTEKSHTAQEAFDQAYETIKPH